MKHLVEKAFTLVELLIVIGIIGILAVVTLVTLNPAEAQRKSRDAKRLKDAVTLQTFLEQWTSDVQPIPAAWNGNAFTSAPTAAQPGATDQPCAANNWLGVNACNYLRTVPRDPLNLPAATRPCAGSGVTNCSFVYQIRVNTANNIDYEIRVRQESAGNATKVTTDGGNDNAGANAWFEITNVTTGVPVL